MPARAHLRAAAGQTIIMGFSGAQMSPGLRSLLREIQPGGVILFARNIQTPQQTWELLHDCAAQVTTPILTCVDMEGGKVDRLRNALAPSPSAADVFSTGDKKLFRKHGRIIGEAVRAFGFNTDFAPVLDLAFGASRSALASRAVSADPKQASTYAREFLAGLWKAGVLGCGKHFPGLGEGKLDSHYEQPIIEKSWKKLWAEDLLPYRKLRSDLPLVIVGHAAYPAITRDHTPASLSQKIIGEVLRKKIGYRGLVLSDDLDMGGVLAGRSVAEAAVDSLRAGCDAFLVCQKQENVLPAWEAVVREAERDRKFAKQVGKASQRVLKFKRKALAHRREVPPKRAVIERLGRELWELGEQVRIAGINRPGNHGEESE